ncbi:MAG TPA: hypothetical protein VFR09_09065 [Alphaproteobacteria bacterium]|nr:hypothetical protein [Alphaproteobacteria bacterium]
MARRPQNRLTEITPQDPQHDIHEDSADVYSISANEIEVNGKQVRAVAPSSPAAPVIPVGSIASPLILAAAGRPANDGDDPEHRTEQENLDVLRNILIAQMIVKQNEDPSFFARFDSALENFTDRASRSFQRHFNSAADAVESASWIPSPLRRGVVNILRNVGDRGRQAGLTTMRAEHSAATIFEGPSAASGDYFEDLARHESGTNDNAHAPTSSAVGRYQFLKGAWLGVVYKHGAAHGGQLAWAASQIVRSGNSYTVHDPAALQQILDMRRDPQYSTPMAIDFTNDNAATLRHMLGNDRQLTNADLYMAHFLGPATAAKFLRAMYQNPNEAAADVVPGAVSANRNIFIDRHTGAERSLSQVYALLGKDFVPTYSTYADNHRPAGGPHADTNPHARA